MLVMAWGLGVRAPLLSSLAPRPDASPPMASPPSSPRHSRHLPRCLPCPHSLPRCKAPGSGRASASGGGGTETALRGSVRSTVARGAGRAGGRGAVVVGMLKGKQRLGWWPRKKRPASV